MRLFRKRKYPIKKDENGRSVRQRTFDLFGKGQRPAQVCKTIPVSPRTAYRYFEDFKKLHHRVPYSTIRKFIKQNPEFSEKVIDILSDSLEMPKEEVVTNMQKNWGLHQAMLGKWPDYKLDKQRTEIENRLLAALEIIKFADIFGQKDPLLVRETLKQIIIDRSEGSLET